MLDKNDNNHKKFYEIIKTKRKSRNNLPTTMNYKSVNYQGEIKYKQLWNHLLSCFVDSQYTFSSINDTFTEQISDIYRANAIIDYLHLWDNYINWFSINEIKQAINSLDVKKDSGPMEISAKFLQYNINECAPILLNMFYAILETGSIPVK